VASSNAPTFPDFGSSMALAFNNLVGFPPIHLKA